jgi:hypothetical protein
MKTSNTAAAIPNPELEPFGVLIGEWKSVGTHPQLPGRTLHGQTSFDWLEGGAFLIMHSEFDAAEIPTAVAIFASDNTKHELFMLFFDERKISRKYEVTFKDNILNWWRSGPEFSQRYTLTFTDDNNTIISKGEISKDGTTWEEDLNQVYTRVK